MSRKSSKDLYDAFTRRIRSLDSTRKRVEKLHHNSILGRVAVEQMYEGLFISAFTAFEGFIENLFVGLMVGNHMKQRGVVPRINVGTTIIAREIVLGPGRQYADWLPYDRTLERANLFFRGGRPFTILAEQQRRSLAQCQTIRNVIAHKSRHSVKKFETQVLGNIPLAPRDRRPGGFLRSQYASNPIQTRFEYFATELILAAKYIVAA